MKLVDELVQQAAADDRLAGELAEKQSQNLERREAYTRLEGLLDQMSKDGYLDRDELETLMAEFRRQGLDTSQLEKIADELTMVDGVEKTAVDNDSLFELRTELADARATTSEDVLFQLQAQELINDYRNRLEAASKVLKAEHEIYMVAIKHLVA